MFAAARNESDICEIASRAEQCGRHAAGGGRGGGPEDVDGQPRAPGSV